MAIERPISDLVLRNAYHCILIPFPKDHCDVSTRELGEKTVPTSTIQEEQSGYPVGKKSKNVFGHSSRHWPVMLHTKLERCGRPGPQTLELCFN